MVRIAFLILASLSGLADAAPPTGYRCGDGTVVLNVGCTCPTGAKAGREADGTAICAAATIRVPTKPPLQNVIGIAASYDAACALKDDGTVVCWGSNFHGGLGADLPRVRGDSIGYRASPVPTGLTGIVQIVGAIGVPTRMCALKSDHTVTCWGVRPNGPKAVDIQQTPTAIANLTDVVQIVTTSTHSCVRTKTGTVLCWGDNSEGGLGDGTTVSRFDEPRLVSGLTDAVKLVAYVGSTCALRSDGTVACWGDNRGFLLGGGTGERSTSPTTVKYVAGAIDVALGREGGCARTKDGKVLCWGYQVYGGSSYRGNSATPIKGLVDAVEIVLQSKYGCARFADGSVQCWQHDGQPATQGSPMMGHDGPPKIAGISTAKGLALGHDFSCALLANATVSCWGANGDGRLGDGTLTERKTPTTPGLVIK